jgi:chorismate dehydratase
MFRWHGLALAGLQFVEQSVEALEIALPKTPVALQPHLEFLERRREQGINAALGIHAHVHQPGLAEHAKMLGDLGLAETQAMDHVADGTGTVAQEFDDMQAVGFGEGPERGDHGTANMPHGEYSCQDIFLDGHIHDHVRSCDVFERFIRGGPFGEKDGYHEEKSALLYSNFREPRRIVTKLRISIVQYLNTAPLVWGFTNGPLQGKYDLSFTVPSQCAEDLRTGRADVAIIPAIEYQRIGDLVILPDMSIASKERVRSLLIVAKKPLEQVKSFALDRSSRSTQALTRILCADKWRIAPQFSEAAPDLQEMLRRADAALVIGDPALRISLTLEKDSWAGDKGQTVCHGDTLGISGAELLWSYDVVSEWRSITRLPAVLAVWAARRDVATAEMTGDFIASRDYGMLRIAEICFDAARELELPAAALESYLGDNIDFSLDEENRRGLQLYFEHAARLGLIPQAKPLEWGIAKHEAVNL